MTEHTLRKLAAFSDTKNGGNPAGVWVGNTLPAAEEMQEIAATVGFSETAFVEPAKGKQRRIRYFSPLAEVPFCGHATIAAGVALALDDGDGEFVFATQSGEVGVQTQTVAGASTAALTSVTPSYQLASLELVDAALAALHWDIGDLDAAIPPAVAYAGAHHLVLAVSTHERLTQLDYDFDALKSLMLDVDLTTLQLVWRHSDSVFHVRNPFPVGGVVEDPATGAAAAAFGGYLRESGLVEVPTSLVLLQGETMGRPSRIEVDIPKAGGIVVRGTAVLL